MDGLDVQHKHVDSSRLQAASDGLCQWHGRTSEQARCVGRAINGGQLSPRQEGFRCGWDGLGVSW